MKTKTKINKQIQRKSKKELVDTIIAAKKKEKWIEVARILSRPRRKSVNLNLEEIDKNAGNEKILVIPGKVLSSGELNKKVKIVALGFSEKAKEKLEKAKIPISYILEEIKKNPEGKGIKILKNENN